MKLHLQNIILISLFIIQSMDDRYDRKNARAIEDLCEKLTQEYIHLKQSLFAYKRDFYIVVCFIIIITPVLGMLC